MGTGSCLLTQVFKPPSPDTCWQLPRHDFDLIGNLCPPANHERSSPVRHPFFEGYSGPDEAVYGLKES